MDHKPVSGKVVNSIVNMMENTQQVEENQRELLEDPTIHTKTQLKESLKQGNLSGKAFVEWKDDKGALRANVIDFISEQFVHAIDPNSGEQVKVKCDLVADNTWRVLY